MLGGRRILLVAGPALWAVLVLFHPLPEGDPYAGVSPVVNRWLAVHVGQLILTPLLVFAVWKLLDGLTSFAATASRWGLIVWATFFSAYDSVQGIATGVLAQRANELAGDGRAGFAAAVDYLVEDSALAGNVSFLAVVAGAAWTICAIAGAVALHRAGAGRATVAATSASIIFAAHTTPAAIGLVALVVGCVLRARQRAEGSAAAPSLS